jgi:hypothetical protein
VAVFKSLIRLGDKLKKRIAEMVRTRRVKWLAGPNVASWYGGSDPKRDPKWARPFCTFSSSEKCEELSPVLSIVLSKVHIARSNIAASSHAKIEAFPYVPLSCVALLFLENNSKTLSAAIVHSCNIF